MSAFSAAAKWISGPVYDYGPDDAGYYADNRNHVLVRDFELDAVPDRVVLRLAVLGYARAYVNGRRVSDAELVGDWTNPTRLVYYVEDDVTALLRPGANQLRVELGNGWYNPSPLTLFGKYNLRQRLAEVGTPQVLAALVARDKDGADRELLASDATWGCTLGNLTFNNVYLGERRDLRLEEPSAQPVRVVGENRRELAPSPVAPIRRRGTVAATDVRPMALDNLDGEPAGTPALVVDLGQMVTGFASLRVAAHEGDVVRVRYAELADAQGRPVFDSNHAGMVGTVIPRAMPDGSDVVVPGGPGAPATGTETDVIVCREGENAFESEFSTHSFRYAAITGLAPEALLDFHATYVHTDLPAAGTLRTGNAWYDELLAAAVRTKLNNIHGTWEDCAREHLGYGGDMVALATSNLCCFDAEGLIRKVVRDFHNDQTAAGGVPETAPYMGIQSLGTGQGEGPLLWQLAYPYLTLKAWQWYGARDLVETEWPHLRRLADYLLSRDPEELSQRCLGDHGSVSTKKADDGDWKGGTPDRAFTGWCAILWHTRLAAQLAAVVGDAQAQARFSAAADGLAATITARFRHADGSFGDGTQTSYAFAGGLGLMDRAAAGDALARLMRQEGDVLSCGIFGASLAWGILHETGHDDAVEAWLNRKASPSYHRMLANGSGSLAEMFEVTVDSYNHAMFSSYAQWLYEALGGIAVADDAVAADHVVISPYLSPATNRVEASLATRSGRVATRWTRGDDGTVELVASIPAGMRADFRAPTGYELVRTSERADDGVVTRSWWLQPQAAPAGSRA